MYTGICMKQHMISKIEERAIILSQQGMSAPIGQLRVKQIYRKSYVEQDADQWGHILTNRAYRDVNHTLPITESYTYNLQGQVVIYMDPNKNLNDVGATKTYMYDALNRLVTVKDALNQLTNYQYDSACRKHSTGIDPEQPE